MKEKESLSEKEHEGIAVDSQELCFRTKDVKEKIQNAKKRLKEEVRKSYGVFDLNVIINKIFLEEFGGKLI